MSAIERLTGLIDAKDRFDLPHAELRDAQIEALNERFAQRRDAIKLLGHRAQEGGVREVRSLDDAVPLLFPHTAYKSYPEGWLVNERWDRLTKWLGTVSAHPIRAVDLADVRDVDDWIDRLEQAGHFVSCSSGTTGKSAMLIASERDMAWSRIDTVNVFHWGSGVEPRRDRRMMGLAPVAQVPKNRVIGEAQAEAFGAPDTERFRYPVPPITVGSLTRMVVLRKAIADGTAKPAEIAELEATSKERQQAMDAAVGIAAEAMVAARGEKLFIAGMWNALYPVAKGRARDGLRRAGFPTRTTASTSAVASSAPSCRRTINSSSTRRSTSRPHRDFQNYSMQELNSGMPKCQKGGRYHVPPWVVPMILNVDGDALLPASSGEIEGRAAFFDLALDGRWGGVITGDRIALDLGPCACGAAGPSIRDDIARYADLEGDDKIGCAGTVDAYVRGVA